MFFTKQTEIIYELICATNFELKTELIQMIREGEHESSRRLKTQHFIERVIVQFNRLQELDEAY